MSLLRVRMALDEAVATVKELSERLDHAERRIKKLEMRTDRYGKGRVDAGLARFKMLPDVPECVRELTYYPRETQDGI